MSTFVLKPFLRTAANLRWKRDVSLSLSKISKTYSPVMLQENFPVWSDFDVEFAIFYLSLALYWLARLSNRWSRSRNNIPDWELRLIWTNEETLTTWQILKRAGTGFCSGFQRMENSRKGMIWSGKVGEYKVDIIRWSKIFLVTVLSCLAGTG